MEFTITCPQCAKTFTLSHEELAQQTAALKCCYCGSSPSPDIMTAYANVGKSMVELYGCCPCSPSGASWLPTVIKADK